MEDLINNPNPWVLTICGGVIVSIVGFVFQLVFTGRLDSFEVSINGKAFLAFQFLLIVVFGMFFFGSGGEDRFTFELGVPLFIFFTALNVVITIFGWGNLSN